MMRQPGKRRDSLSAANLNLAKNHRFQCALEEIMQTEGEPAA